MSLLLGANLVIAVFAFSVAADIPFGHFASKPRAVMAMLLLLFVNYWRFVRNGDADDLIRKLQYQGKRQTRREERLLLLYEVSSLTAPFVIAIIRAQAKG